MVDFDEPINRFLSSHLAMQLAETGVAFRVRESPPALYCYGANLGVIEAKFLSTIEFDGIEIWYSELGSRVERFADENGARVRVLEILDDALESIN